MCVKHDVLHENVCKYVTLGQNWYKTWSFTWKLV